MLLFFLSGLSWVISLFLGLSCISGVHAATTDQTPFPNVSFQHFSNFITGNFSSNISLATVLLVLFSLIENPELLNLHARQVHPVYRSEKKVQASSWLKILSRALETRLDKQVEQLFPAQKYMPKTVTRDIALKLHNLSELLQLTPYDSAGQFQKKLGLISCSEIEPIRIICPISMTCTTSTCKPVHLEQLTKIRDIPEVTLIQGNTIWKKVLVLTGKCNICHTHYGADHESFLVPVENQGSQIVEKRREIYLNHARYLKVGSNLWVDRIFSNSVLNAMYSFHASVNTYTQYWNNTFGSTAASSQFKIGRKHIWQTFTQESIRAVAQSTDTEFESDLNLSIDEVVGEAFEALGNNGVMLLSKEHTCSECTKPYKQADGLIVSDAAPVKMIVLDGIVMGPTYCAYPNCQDSLLNARGGSFCPAHEIEYGDKCRVVGCIRKQEPDTQACSTHAPQWKKNVSQRSKSTLTGLRRILRTGAQEPWQRGPNNRSTQPHDAGHPEGQERKNYFSPNRWYCVETMCAPCGVVLAWTKFAKSESPSNILSWLQEVYPLQEDRPAYICIDKACQVMKTAVINRVFWQEWKNTTRFIVDSFYYNNHRATDTICRTWCNPAPQDGSAPNLVGEKIDKNGNTVKVREFNTEACEQLNAWLGGYESILKRMTVENFNWFLHVMLFYHVKYVLAKKTSTSSENTIQNTINDEESDKEDSDDNESSNSSDVSQIISSYEEGGSNEDEDEDNMSVENEANSSEESGSNESTEEEDDESEENNSSKSDVEKSSGSTNSDVYMHLSD